MAVLERRAAGEITIEDRADGPGLVRGAAMPYGDTARIGPGLEERFEAGAFTWTDVLVNVQHDRGRLLASLTGGLALVDGPSALLAEIALPDTQEGSDAGVLIRRGALRGLSVEFVALRERMLARQRIIQAADLQGLALVDRPAYPSAVVSIRAELRQDGQGLAGAFNYGLDRIIGDRGAVRKRRVSPGAFRYALQDESREINLILGRSFDQPLASKRTGTLQLIDSPDALTFRVERLPDTGYARDFRASIDGGGPPTLALTRSTGYRRRPPFPMPWPRFLSRTASLAFSWKWCGKRS